MGVSGLGVAFTHIAASLAPASGVRFVAATDLRSAALDAFRGAYGGRAYDDFGAMCRDPEIDAIYIATPNALHASQAIEAASHGKHVIVDKPMATSVDECAAMVRAAEDGRVYLVCGHLHSYGPAIREMRRIIVSGELGALRMINTWHFNEWVYRPRASWEFEPGSGGNVVFNQGAHQVDIVRLLGGGVARSVRATVGSWDAARPIDGAYSAYLDFDGGVSATLVYNGYAHFDTAELTGWAGEMPRDAEWNRGARGRLGAMTSSASEDAAKESWRFGTGAAEATDTSVLPPVLFGLTVASCERGDIRQTPAGLRVYRDDGVADVPVPPGPNYSAAALENLYAAIVDGEPILRDGRWGEATVEVLAAMMASSSTTEPVMLSRQMPSAE